jgi:predicted choloylglycine hydrolase
VAVETPAVGGFEQRSVELTFRAVDAGPSVSHRLPAIFAAGWPAYRAWFLRDGEHARPSQADGAAALRRHMPELAPLYEELVPAVGGGDLQARFLSQWCPPPVAAACSLAVWNRLDKVLVRSYDYPAALCDTTAMASGWSGTGVLAMSDCLWGAVDGINEHGLAVAIAFGGRPVVGPGFGIGLVVRYILQVASDARQGLEILDRVPVSMAYNVALLDRAGAGAVVRVGPDRPTALAPGLTAGNRQGWTEWAEHAAMCATVEREQVLADTVADPGSTSDALVRQFLRAPIQRDPATTAWGTVYTAAYRPDLGTLDLIWPDDSWRLSLHHLVEGQRTRRVLSVLSVLPVPPVPPVPPFTVAVPV